MKNLFIYTLLFLFLSIANDLNAQKTSDILASKNELLNSPNINAKSIKTAQEIGQNKAIENPNCPQSNSRLISTLDMDNKAITAFDLSTLRKNNRYGLVENYKENRARIRKDQVYGFLNLCGDETITCQYERAEAFNLGFALVKRVDWYFIDGEGNESDALENVVEAKALKNGMSMVRMGNNTAAIIDNNFSKTKVSLSLFYDEINNFYKNNVFTVRNAKKIGLIGLNGKVILKPIYDGIDTTNLSGIYRISQNKNIGLFDSTWTIRTPLNFESISDFNEFGIATAKSKSGLVLIHSKNYKQSKSYTYISDFNEFGVSIIKNEGNLFGLIDTGLNIIVEPKYASIDNFNELGLAAACTIDGKCGFIKFDGKEQIKANYKSVGEFNNFGFAVARIVVENCKSKEGVCEADIVIDKNGNTIIPVSDESIEKKWQYEVTDSLFAGDRYLIVNVLEDKKKAYLLIKKSNAQLITATPFQAISAMDRFGNFRVKKNGKWGIIDSVGKILTKPTYQAIERVQDELYATQNDKGKWGFLNKKGKPQIPFEYEEVHFFKMGFAPVSKGRGKWGLITHFNAKIVPCSFRSVVVNSAETKFEITDENNVVYILNDKGECETNCPKFEQFRANANKIEVERK